MLVYLGLECAFLIYLGFISFLWGNFSFMNRNSLFYFGRLNQDFLALFIYFGFEFAWLLQLLLLDLSLLLFDILVWLLLPSAHLFVKLVVWSCSLLRWLLKFWELKYKSLIFLLLFLSFLLLVLKDFFVFRLNYLLVSMLNRLMPSHLVDKQLWLFVNSGVEL